MNLTSSEIQERIQDPNFFKIHIARDRVGMYPLLRAKGILGDYDRSQYRGPGGLDERSLQDDEMPILITKAMHLNAETGEKFALVEGFGSSEAEDTESDQITTKAMGRMCEVSAGMTTWIDHKFTQDWLFGSLQESPFMAKGINPKNGAEFQGVRVKSDVEFDNANAERSYKYIAKGRRLGWSVGCIYKEVEKLTDRRTGRTKGVRVHDLDPIEWSIVGMPSNQLCWAQAVTKSMSLKGLLDRDDEREIAYVFKASNFQDMPPAIAGRFEKLNAWLDQTFPEAGLCLSVKAAKVQELIISPDAA